MSVILYGIAHIIILIIYRTRTKSLLMYVDFLSLMIQAVCCCHLSVIIAI